MADVRSLLRNELASRKGSSPNTNGNRVSKKRKVDNGDGVMRKKLRSTDLETVEAAANAHRSSGNRLAEGELPQDLLEIEVSFDGAQAPIAAVLNRSGLASNSAQAKDMLGNGRVRVDGEVVAKDHLLESGESYVIQAGKKRYARVIVR